jgi:triosephosphate isomerase
MRKVFIGGNWKSNGNVSFVKSHFEKVLNQLKFDSNKVDVVVSPMSIHLGLAKEVNKGNVQISSQNVSLTKEGAFTGEVSAIALKDFGINWTLIGHSERRSLYGESSTNVADKILLAEGQGLNSIACIGETKDERTSGKTLNVIFEQLNAIKDKKPDWSKIVIAYEPVWAIGTGLTATPDQAQEVHSEIRKWLKKEVSEKASNETRIIYGGSVTEKNSDELIKKTDIDGFLVGGASLKPEFVKIVESYKSKH